MKYKILQRDESVLRDIAKEVVVEDIENPRIQNVIKKMKIALYNESDGVAIAAPQIGESLRIFIVSGRVSHMMERKELAEGEILPPDLVFINPKLIKLSKTKKVMEEGCLSVRWLYGQVNRSTKATIVALDENGNKFQKGASGILAQIFQHETDHLNGILFIDKATNLENIPPEKNAEV
jgi:peptide deformylase